MTLQRHATGPRSSAAVLHVITDNDRRGGQVFATDLHAALKRRGVHVRIVALAPASSPAGLDHEVLGPTRRHPRTLRQLRSAMEQSSITIAHGSTTLPMCAMASVGLNVPFVYRQISEQLFWAHTPGRRARARLALRAAAHVTALWQGAADVLASNFGVPRSRITIVPNGVPAERCPPMEQHLRREARERFGLDSDRPTLVSIGALVPEKGVDVIVRAMGQSELSGWQLLVVGAGAERARLEGLAREIPDGLVRFHDPVGSGAEAMAAADVVGLTSRGGDSMPAVLIEAGMMGIPVVATPVEGIVDIVLDRQTGRLVPLDDPVATARAVAETAGRAKEWGEAARAHCYARFEIEEITSQWQDVLESVSSRL